MQTRGTVVLLFTASVFVVPAVLLAVLPVIRTPSKRSRREIVHLPAGVLRSMTPNGLEMISSGTAEAKGTQAPLLLVHGGFGSVLCYTHWLPYLASKGRAVYAVSLPGKD